VAGHRQKKNFLEKNICHLAGDARGDDDVPSTDRPRRCRSTASSAGRTGVALLPDAGGADRGRVGTPGALATSTAASH